MEQTDEGVLLQIKVKPSSSHFTFKTNPKGELIMELKAPAEKDQANTELVRRLKAIFRKDVSLLRGQKSKTKTILVRGATATEIKDKL
jgi:uncharacterized protein (TIGR00251 family)